MQSSGENYAPRLWLIALLLSVVCESAGSIRITWEPVKNTESVVPQTYGIRILTLVRSVDNLYAH